MAGDKLDGQFSRVSVSDDRYRMDRPYRGQFLIINNKIFDPAMRMGERTGTDVDAANLKELFGKMGFNVKLVHNQSALQMMRLVETAAGADHKDSNCFGLAVLSHGDQGILYGTDTTVDIDNLVAPLKHCASLAGKPKICFFQACRGSQLDEGREVADAEGEHNRVARIPLEADFLYAYSTTPGYFSWRNSNKGSWFVQALYRVLGELWNTNMDLCRILTRVNHAVAYEFESNAAQAHMNAKKQVPSIVSMLTKDLYFG